MAYAKKVDKNQVLIVKTLRDYGAQVFHLHMVAKGMPDIMCCYADQTILMEVKDGEDKKLTPQQITLFANWIGGPLVRVDDVESALRILRMIDLDDDERC